MDREIKSRIERIVFVSLFLIVSTLIWTSSRNANNESMALYNDMRSLKVEEVSDGVALQGAYPVSDEVGLTNDSYKFNVTNTGNEKVFNVYFESCLPTNTNIKIMPNNAVRYQIIKNNEVFVSPKNLDDTGLLFSDTTSANTNHYELVFWIDKDATNEIMGTTFSSKIVLK